MDEQILNLENEIMNLGDAPKLELSDEEIKDINQIVKSEAQVKKEENKFTAEEEKAIKEFSEKIDITNTNQVLQYGAGAQQHIATFSETALDRVRTKDMGEAGKLLSDLVVELKGFSPVEEKGFGLFKKASNSIEKLKAKYSKVEANVDKIVEILENHEVTLLKDVALYEKMYELNTAYFKELAMYIAAGKMCLENAKNTTLVEAQKKAEQSGLAEDAQKAKDLGDMINRFEKRLYDLELTRTISVQMGPQIRLVQNNDSLMLEKIHSSLVNTIPLWKSQMVLALGIAHSKQAMQAQREVTDMTNKLLKQNADLLKSGTVETAKESERGIVDIETLKYTNEQLIQTIDEVLRIQNEGQKKRTEAQGELVKIENELKSKLLEVKRNVEQQ